MTEYTFCDLTKMDVVNTIDGKNLGKTIDMVIKCDGSVKGLVVMGDKKLFKAVTKDTSLFVPWKHICKVGEDVILVKLGNNNTDNSENT